jgi:acyl-CoA thioesterase
VSTNSDPERSYLEELRVRGRDANPFFLLMGIRVARMGGGEAALEMTVRPDMHNGLGWLQGGILVALADEAMALGLFTALDAHQQIATISESTSFLKGTRDGTLVATGRVIKRGRKVAFTEGEVCRDGDVLSRTTGVFSLLTGASANGRA